MKVTQTRTPASEIGNVIYRVRAEGSLSVATVELTEYQLDLLGIRMKGKPFSGSPYLKFYNNSMIEDLKKEIATLKEVLPYAYKKEKQ